MPLFFIIFFTIYSLANFYVLRRFFQALPSVPDFVRYILLVIFVLAALAYILTRALLAANTSILYDIALWIGSFWFAFLLYGFIYCLLVDEVRLLNYLLNRFTHYQLLFPRNITTFAFWAGLVLTVGMTAYGYVNAGNISVKRLSINISKGKRPEQKMKILYFSDTHLTPVNNGRIMDQILSCMEEYKPDLILMGGDIVDDHSRQLQRFALDEKLARLTAPLGVYTCPGNHEYISGYEDASKVLAQAGITILRDSMVVINNSLQLIGRDDPSGARFWGKRRKSLEELTRSADKSLPLILLDHQPFNLEKSSAAGINLQLSGHTHHGQMFPANLVTANIYELSRGYLKKDETHFYVSSGAGTWGPPVRTGSRSEVVCIDLQY